MADQLRQLLSPDEPGFRAGPDEIRICAACSARTLQRREPDLAVFHAVARPDGEVRQTRSRQPLGLLRSACDGLAGPVQSSPVVGHRDNRTAGRACGDEYHDSVTGLSPAEAARGSWLEVGVS